MREIEFLDGPLEGQTRSMRTPTGNIIDVPEGGKLHRYRYRYLDDRWTARWLTSFNIT